MNKFLWLMPALCLAATGTTAAPPADPERLDAVAERGRVVMPFDLEKTTHVFTATDSGGRQQVRAKNPADGEQIRLIRKHLAEIAAAFARGDFSGPARIHGEAMPGLVALRDAKPGLIEYRYRGLPDGGEIDYVSRDPGLIAAVHRFFEAQLSDHARHAVPGMAGHEGHHP